MNDVRVSLARRSLDRVSNNDVPSLFVSYLRFKTEPQLGQEGELTTLWLEMYPTHRSSMLSEKWWGKLDNETTGG